MSLAAELRAVLVVAAFRSSFAYPVPAGTIHSASYFCDALAPIWGFPPLDDIVLKTGELPRSAALQTALDNLVGMAMLVPSNLRHSQRRGRAFLEADFALHDDFAEPLLTVMREDEGYRLESAFVEEVSLALAAMGTAAGERAIFVDANYANPLAGSNSVLDLDPDDGHHSQTELVGLELEKISLERGGGDLTPAEVTALYTRHLYRLLAEPVS